MANLDTHDSAPSEDGASPAFDSPSAHAPGEPRRSAGDLVREAREKSGIPAAKLCADLRLSPTVLAAIEAGDYAPLAGPPYVRATLVSLSRYLRLDSREVLKAYADEAGEQDAAPAAVSPYKDDSGTHAKAHKQIFILLLAILLFILLLIMGKVNTSSPEPEPAAPPAAADTLLNIEPPADTTLNDSLSDSLGVRDSATASYHRADTATRADSVRKTASLPVTEGLTHVRVTAVTDSVWLRVLPAGERESSRFLRLGKPMEFRHDEAITFITRKGGTVRIVVGDQETIPADRRFKVDGTEITD